MTTTETPDALLKLARRIADGVCLNGSSRDAAYKAALAGIRETTRLAAEYIRPVPYTGDLSDALKEALAVMLEAFAHLKETQHDQ